MNTNTLTLAEANAYVKAAQDLHDTKRAVFIDLRFGPGAKEQPLPFVPFDTIARATHRLRYLRQTIEELDSEIDFLTQPIEKLTTDFWIIAYDLNIVDEGVL